MPTRNRIISIIVVLGAIVCASCSSMSGLNQVPPEKQTVILELSKASPSRLIRGQKYEFDVNVKNVSDSLKWICTYPGIDILLPGATIKYMKDGKEVEKRVPGGKVMRRGPKFTMGKDGVCRRNDNWYTEKDFECISPGQSHQIQTSFSVPADYPVGETVLKIEFRSMYGGAKIGKKAWTGASNIELPVQIDQN
jgi:hypothetical protein